MSRYFTSLKYSFEWETQLRRIKWQYLQAKNGICGEVFDIALGGWKQAAKCHLTLYNSQDTKIIYGDTGQNILNYYTYVVSYEYLSVTVIF